MRRSHGLLGVVVGVGISISLLGQRDATSDTDVALDQFTDGAAEPVTETPDPPPPDQEPAPPEHEPGTLYPADEGALAWDDLKPEEKAQAERAQEWAETANGADVHNAFSAAVATTTVLREVEQAQDSTGLQGIEDVGVVP